MGQGTTAGARAAPAALTCFALAGLACVALAACGSGAPSTAVAATSPARVSTPAEQASTAAPSASSPAGGPTAAKTKSPTAPPPSGAAPRQTAAPVGTWLAPVPRAGAEPPTRFPGNRAAVGSGANPDIGPVPDSVWARMVGYSWTSGCPVGRSSLRYLTVNFWGFDGRRSRGALVVSAGIATPTATAFTQLYDQRFRIRQMKVMDSGWGHNPMGPGADDYAAMEADNTSAFNCRYVGGEESKKVWSNHAYGNAIDINDFENPYVDERGRVYPDPWFVNRRSGAGVFSSTSSRAVRAFTVQGFRWGGIWSAPDYQHFDVAR